MTRTPALVLVTLLLASRALGAATPDFSGTWVLDVERSWVGVAEREPLPPETLNVRQTETTLVLDADPARDLGVSSIPLPEPGRSTAVDETRDVQSRWWDGRLVVTTGWGRRHATGMTTVFWSMSADGNELTLDGSGLDQDFSRPNVTVKTELKFRRVYQRRH